MDDRSVISLPIIANILSFPSHNNLKFFFWLHFLLLFGIGGFHLKSLFISQIKLCIIHIFVVSRIQSGLARQKNFKNVQWWPVRQGGLWFQTDFGFFKKIEFQCPLCMESFDMDDINFFPCQCQYQICRFCWHRIR